MKQGTQRNIRAESPVNSDCSCRLVYGRRRGDLTTGSNFKEGPIGVERDPMCPIHGNKLDGIKTGSTAPR